MPVIEEMDEFVNWDDADPSAGIDLSPLPHQYGEDETSHDLDLALENVDGDDFGFLALQHYENTHVPSLDPALTQDAPQSWWETPEAACHHCQAGGYLCKKIQEGKYKGYCTSCVALRCECSFGPSSSKGPIPGATFPANPWPKFGDHPDAIPQEDVAHERLHRTSAPDLAALTATAPGPEPSPTTANAPKVGARFSRESVKVLKNWLSTHGRHPYPTEEEKDSLQRLTGLNKTQITNWLANARRRGKIRAPRSTSPHVRSWSSPIDIPPRRGTPSFENMNPLQRWQNSPPENEPASVTAIARAVSASDMSSGLNSPFSLNYSEDGSNRSLCNGSSASSVGTSQSSNGSFASAFSHASRGSFGSLGSLNRGRRRRRRRTAPKRAEEGPVGLTVPLKTFQCTFCTETFRTKHDWQRHEKSLHLSLERWVCAPDGPRALNPENNKVACVFCGEADPDEAHIESHNHSACQERSLEERTFYRKDHLRQHLKLVHNVKFLGWSMEPWKVATPEIRSRCGFCGIVMDSWSIRVDHLAEHFKTGNTMADWKGDWGFEAPVLDMVENSIPPYLIHDERNSPLPYEASRGSPATPRNAYELIKSELAWYATGIRETEHRNLTDDELQIEACRIVFGSEVLSKRPLSSSPSWLRDLIMSSDDLAQQAKLRAIRGPCDSRMAQLKINGKDNLFQDCAMECEMREYVKARSLLGLTAMDSELQVEACNILGRIEESSNMPSDEIANFLLRLIHRSPRWLANFRQRAHLPRSEDLGDEHERSKDPLTIDSTIHNYSRLEKELADYVQNQRSLGVEPDDADLQRQARIIIYEYDDGWNQTAADNVEWLNGFKQRHLLSPSPDLATLDTAMLNLDAMQPSPSTATAFGLPGATTGRLENTLLTPGMGVDCAALVPLPKTGPFFFNDANCYRRLARELSRYAASAMSPNNPNRHVPTDEELQHQARWILYDDDDPWNQTAADNAEWLRRFKRDAGIITDDGDGLPVNDVSWHVQQGGTGFAPPYVFPKTAVAPLLPPSATTAATNTTPTTAALNNLDANITLLGDGGAKAFEASAATANKFLQSLTTRLDPPAAVFCSRELEKGLAELARAEVSRRGQLPADDALRARAREILRMPSTAADDDVLLEKFKAMMREKLGMAGEAGANAVATTSAARAPAVGVGGNMPSTYTMPAGADVDLSEKQIDEILSGMDLDLDLELDLGPADGM